MKIYCIGSGQIFQFCTKKKDVKCRVWHAIHTRIFLARFCNFCEILDRVLSAFLTEAGWEAGFLKKHKKITIFTPQFCQFFVKFCQFWGHFWSFFGHFLTHFWGHFTNKPHVFAKNWCKKSVKKWQKVTNFDQFWTNFDPFFINFGVPNFWSGGVGSFQNARWWQNPIENWGREFSKRAVRVPPRFWTIFDPPSENFDKFDKKLTNFWSKKWKFWQILTKILIILIKNFDKFWQNSFFWIRTFAENISCTDAYSSSQRATGT